MITILKNPIYELLNYQTPSRSAPEQHNQMYAPQVGKLEASLLNKVKSLKYKIPKVTFATLSETYTSENSGLSSY